MEKKEKKPSLDEAFDQLASTEEYTTYKAIMNLYDPEGTGDAKSLNDSLRQKLRRLKQKGKVEVLPGPPTQFRYKPEHRYSLSREQQENRERQLRYGLGTNVSRLFLTDGLCLLMEGEHAKEPKFQLEMVEGLRNGDIITHTQLEKCLGKYIIQFKYMEEFENEITVTFSPALLREFNSRWNIVGFLHNLEHPDTEPLPCHIPLDRVVRDGMIFNGKKATFKIYTDQEAQEKLGIRFKKANPGFFVQRYKDVVGMTVPNDHEVETIVLKALNKKDYMYLKTKPLHPSQLEVRRDLQGNLLPHENQQKDHLDDRKEWLFTIKVKWNFELMAKVLGFGAGLVVEGNSGLAKRIKEEIARMAKNYGI